MYIVLNGGGKVASALARMLTDKKHTVVIIERRQEIADKLASELAGREAIVILGDGCDYNVQDEAGVARADIFVAVTGEDDDNLVSCQLANLSFDVPRAISRVNNPKNVMIFRKLGIEAISSTFLISRMIEEEATVGDLHTLRTLRQGNLSLVEFEIPEDAMKGAVGKPLSELALPKECRIVAIIPSENDDDDIEIARSDSILEPGDTVIALVSPEQEKALDRVLKGE